jgi:TatA/E family protein of Tat protein translocase
MLDIGIQEVVILMVVALLVFGPDRLPELGRRLGRAMREFRRASDEFRSTIETNLQINEDSILSPSSSTWTPAAGSTASEPAPASSPDGDGTGASAGTPDGAPPEGAPTPAGAAATDPYWTRRGGRLLHRAGCGWQTRIPEGERIGVRTLEEAQQQGLQACPVCAPRDVELIA